MILYHGTNIRFEEIDLNKSNTNKDFGKGFYLSDTRKQAEEMAAFKVDFFGGEILVNEYEVPDNILESCDLNVKVFKEYSKEWAEFVFKNRSNSSDVPCHDYDIVYGPIANDRVGVQIRKFQNGHITFEEFLRNILYMKGITFQYFFATEQAVSKLKRL